MTATQRITLEQYLAFDYPFHVIADPEGGYVVTFPDLKGCLTQVETLQELPAAVEEACTLWLETAYEQGIDIPLPSYPEECSGKILLRIPKSLHRRLLDQAEHEGVSLNQYATSLLARGDAQAALEGRLAGIEQQLHYLHDQLQHYQVSAPTIRQRPRLNAVAEKPQRYGTSLDEQHEPSPAT